MSEWILCVGQHPGLIPGGDRVNVQQQPARSKTKTFRQPRTNEALLTGLLRCGGHMYPSLSGRKTAEGKTVFACVCKLKERSRGSVCRAPNVSGNRLDAAVLQMVQVLTGDPDCLIAQLEKSRHLCAGSRTEQEGVLAALRQEQSEAHRRLAGLVDSLADLSDIAARELVSRRIGQLSAEAAALDQRIAALLSQGSRSAPDSNSRSSCSAPSFPSGKACGA